MKLLLLALAQLSAVMLVSCKYKDSWSIKKDLPNLGFQLKYLTKNVRSVIKQYGKKHSVFKALNFERVDLASRCSGKIWVGYTPTRVRAAEIMKILQEFVGEMQQLQMDEINLPKGSQSLTQSIRHLEYELRDFAEHSFRKMIRKGMGSMIVAYGLGTLPSNAKAWINADETRKRHLMSLYQLLHCLNDVRHAVRPIWRGFAYQNQTKHKYSKY